MYGTVHYSKLIGVYTVSSVHIHMYSTDTYCILYICYSTVQWYSTRRYILRTIYCTYSISLGSLWQCFVTSTFQITIDSLTITRFCNYFCFSLQALSQSVVYLSIHDDIIHHIHHSIQSYSYACQFVLRTDTVPLSDRFSLLQSMYRIL